MLVREHFRPTGNPVADPANVVTGDRYRITRADRRPRAAGVGARPASSRTGRARPSSTARSRPPSSSVVETDDRLKIHTARLQLVYDKRPFSTEGLSVQAKGGFHSDGASGGSACPRPTSAARRAPSTTSTAPVPLEPGILARDGVACSTTPRTVLLTDDGWIAPRRPDTLDLYVFAYGRDYQRRAARLLPADRPARRCCRATRWATGGAATTPTPPTSTSRLMDRFARRGRCRCRSRCSTWTGTWSTSTPRHGSGWTGYTWNRDLFPDPPAFLAALHERGLATTAQRAPGRGRARATRSAYAAIARADGRRPATASCRSTSTRPTRTSCEAYLEELHHPLEDEGVDFWWLDWQQGGVTRMPGLDPLWLLNHFHFLDSGAGRAGGR